MERINWISGCRTLCWITLCFWKKIHIRNEIFQKLTRPPKFSMWPSAAILFLFGFCRFPDTSGQLRKIKIGWFEAEKSAVTGEKNFIRLSQKERLLEPIEKKSFAVITGESVSALFWWSRRFIYFFFFILLQFCYWKCEANLPRLREHLQPYTVSF